MRENFQDSYDYTFGTKLKDNEIKCIQGAYQKFKDT